MAIWHERSKAIILIQLYIYNGTCHYQCTVGENIIGALKMRNNHGAIKLFLFFQYCYRNMRVFSIAPCTIIALYLFCLFLVLVPFFFLYCSFYNYRDLGGVSDPLPLGARKSDNYMGSNKEKKPWTNEQPQDKNKAKRLRATTLLLQSWKIALEKKSNICKIN